MRILFALLIIVIASAQAHSCAGGMLESFDWADPTYAPRDNRPVDAAYFIGRVERIDPLEDGRFSDRGQFGRATLKIMKQYRSSVRIPEVGHKLTRITFSGTSCGGVLKVGQVGMFVVVKTDNGDRLAHYQSAF